MRSRLLGHRPRRFASPKALLTVAVALSALALGGGAGGSTGGAVLSKSGPADEGPYPYAYPATGSVKVGQGTTVSGLKCKPGVNQFGSPYADPASPSSLATMAATTDRGVDLQRESSSPNASSRTRATAKLSRPGRGPPEWRSPRSPTRSSRSS